MSLYRHFLYVCAVFEDISRVKNRIATAIIAISLFWRFNMTQCLL